MLPVLRDDLSLHAGPADGGGAPTWVIRDPVRNRFFRLTWPAYEVLVRWSQGTPEVIAEAVSRETTLSMTADDVQGVARFLLMNQLARVSDGGEARRLAARAEAERRSWFHWLLHHYLFFRVPLVRSDRVLTHFLPWVRWMGSAWFRWLTLVALVCGLLLVGRQWDLFVTTLVDTASVAGLLSYAVALAGVKVVHELAHACVTKHFGGRVPTMGVAFLVLWPMLYTDVNDAWMFRTRRQRLFVGGAGILAELTIAAWATLAWAFLPEGPSRQAAFVLAALTWVSSLAINLMPFMRFDGYFLVMDALDMPNLHPRAFAMARWWLREKLFGLGAPAPESMAPRKRRLLVAFAVFVWIYRLVLFLGIAVMVYHFFIKAVGILLFALEITWFVLMPIWMEVKAWHQSRTAILARRRVRWTAAILGAALVVAAVPWSGTVTSPGVLKAGAAADLFLPFPARLEAVLVERGAVVRAGQPLMSFIAPDLDQRRLGALARLDGRQAELRRAQLDPDLRPNLAVTREGLREAEAELAALDAETNRLVLSAPWDGVVLDLLPDMASGDWLSPRQSLGLVRGEGARAVAYVAEDDIGRLAVGAEARFLPTSPDFPARDGRVLQIDTAPVKVLRDEVLASLHDGPLPSRVSGRDVVPDGGFVRVVVEIDGPPPPLELVGGVAVEGERRSLIGRLARSVMVVLVREWSA